MIDDLKYYPTMKDSGVEWLGEVPAHWDIRRLRTIAEIRISNVDKIAKNDECPVRLCNYTDVYNNDLIRADMPFMSATASTEEIERFRLQIGDVLITKDSEAWNDIGVPALVGSTSDDLVSGYHLALLRPDVNKICGAYLSRSLSSRGIANQFHVRSNGVTRFGLSQDAIKSVWLALPSLPEQIVIARFLDHADQRIRRYIRAKEKLIALLEEQKQAIVHEAVTGRIDVRSGQPYPTYKPSGIEWLGNVPMHWEVRRVKSLSTVKRGASPRPIGDSRYFDTNGEFAWVRISDVTASDKFLEETTQRLSPHGQSLSVELKPGALFLSIAGSVGKPIITKIKCCIHDGFVYFPQFLGNIEFLYRIFSCKEPFAKLGKLGTQLNLNTDTVGAICLGWPPSAEQEDIVNFLNDATRGIELAIASARREIGLLHEYRIRLIADVVTGKLDVREAVAALPEEANGPDAAEGDRAGSAGRDEGRTGHSRRTEIAAVQEEMIA